VLIVVELIYRSGNPEVGVSDLVVIENENDYKHCVDQANVAYGDS